MYDIAKRNDFYLFVGYEFNLNNHFNLSIDLSLGYTSLRNEQRDRIGSSSFKDTGTTYGVSTTLEYTLNEWLGIYFRPEYRFIDFSIVAPSSVNDFDNGALLNFSLGLRVCTRLYNDQMNEVDIDDARLEKLSNKPEDELTIEEKRELYFYRKKAIRKQRRKR